MINLTIAGRLGRDASYKQTQGGAELCSFPVAADIGYGDSKQTIWVDVTRWGKGAQGLSDILRKGSAVAVTGELSTREHDGKTYLQCRADKVTILGGTGERKASYDSNTGQGGGGNVADDLDDSDIPF